MLMSKTDVLQKIDDGWRRLTELVEGIDPTTFVQPVKDDWSPKDHVAHVAAWEEYMLAILEKRDRHRSMDVGDLRGKETDEINDAVFQARRNLTPDEVQTSLAESHRKVRAAIEALSDSDLQRPRSDFQPDIEDDEAGDETLLDEIEWNTWGHYDKHIEWLTALIPK
jgi:hypothetical protein